jgi:exodeoxyribonuclease-1
MTIDNLLDASLPCHYDMIRSIRAKLIEWSPATFIGYNSMRFDEELLRKALFRTLHSPYLTNTDGNCRADAMTLVQLANVFVPGCLRIPESENGKPSFKLDRIAPINGFDHSNAHDALADVMATIHLAKCVRERAPEVWDRFLRCAPKAAALACLDEEAAVFLTEVYFNKPYHFVVSAIGAEPNSGAIFALDLKHDVDWIASLQDDELKTWVGKSPTKIRRVRANAAPHLATIEETSDEMLAPLTREQIANRAARLQGDQTLQKRLVTAAIANATSYEDSPFIEEQIYSGGFVSGADQDIMAKFHEAPWSDRVAIIEAMRDERLRYHGRLLIYEVHPELLSDESRCAVEATIWERLLAQETPKDTWTSLRTALADTETMIAEGEAGHLDMLYGLRDHLLARIQYGSGLLKTATERGT